jgi:hypothetical protein
MLNIVWIVTTLPYNQPVEVSGVPGAPVGGWGAIGKGALDHDGRI